MPMQVREFLAYLRECGVEVANQKRGSHKNLSKPGYPNDQLTCHNDEKGDVSDVYIKKICKRFELPLPIGPSKSKKKPSAPEAESASADDE